ncbi:6295_t:CDS:1, partial [Dentiscutata erythropus]
TEYRIAIDLLDNIISATLDNAILFRSGSFMEYTETIFRI